MRIPRRSEAKSTSQHTNNQKAESWNGGWIQEKQCETELWKMPGLDMPHGPSPRESSSVQLLHPLQELARERVVLQNVHHATMKRRHPLW